MFRRALVSWYGPGLYGGHLACGGRLSPSTLGVANKHLPCGTLVTLRHRGRSVRVPVVDRGPYVGAREYDLTKSCVRCHQHMREVRDARLPGGREDDFAALITK